MSHLHNNIGVENGKVFCLGFSKVVKTICVCTQAKSCIMHAGSADGDVALSTKHNLSAHKHIPSLKSKVLLTASVGVRVCCPGGAVHLHGQCSCGSVGKVLSY